MFVIDYLKQTDSDCIEVPPFHGHLGLMPDSDYYISLLHAPLAAGGCEICITPYEQQLEFLFSLRCVLKEQRGVVNRLLRAIAAMDVNIVSWESSILETNGGHGVFMLLDWSTTKWRAKDVLSRNLQEVFFPRLSGIVPSGDLRYIRLLRQILGQCADLLLWEENTSDGLARPRLRLAEFDEGRHVSLERQVTVTPAVSTGVRLRGASVSFSVPPDVSKKARLITDRDNASLHYILVSDSESKTLRAFIPLRGHERRMVHLGFIHNDRPGALCAITDFIAKSQFSIVSGLVRRLADRKNILEATLRHDSVDCSRQELSLTPQKWADRFLKQGQVGNIKDWMRYYGVHLAPPVYPKAPGFEPVPLFDAKSKSPVALAVISGEQAELDLEEMARRAASEREFMARRWLTELLFAGDWSAGGKPSVFLSYPKSGSSEGEFLRESIDDLVHVRILQEADAGHITPGAIERIVHAHYFIGLWHPEKGRKTTLSPWMQFEFGVALSHNKDCLILSHDSLPEKLVGRIDPDRGRIVYKDLVNQRSVIERVRERCKMWAAAHRTLSLTEKSASS